MKFIELTVTNKELGPLNIHVNPEHISVFYKHENDVYVEVGGRNVYNITQSLTWLRAQLENQ